MVSFSTREARRVRIATLIFEEIEEGIWFRAQDLFEAYQKDNCNHRTSCLTVRDIAKMLPIFGLESKRMNGYKWYYRKHLECVSELYIRRTRLE